MRTQAPPQIERPTELQTALDAAYHSKPKDYAPRTHLRDGSRARYVNRLILEPSPYLAQHAHNPVDWWPFGPEALAEAARLDVPIFLSAGYATCHWCHVMEEESFDNEEVAALLNANFLPIKLDREQRPDIDAFYMLATTLQHRQGGWPNSIWTLPDGRPFHTGTYFSRPHFVQILGAIAEGWRGEKRGDFEHFAGEFTRSIQTVQMRTETPGSLFKAAATALDHLSESFNAQNGGFSKTTQFPQEGNLLFLLDHWRRTGDRKALNIATKTLTEIAAGGIHDHVGGGFHRYTVDVSWRTPHFEKMLYNQALLLRAMTEAYLATGEGQFRHAANRTVLYVLRDMTAPDGAFYAAEDADSLDVTGKLEEGAFYTWTPQQAETALRTDLYTSRFGLNEAPTLEAGSVLHLPPEKPVPTQDEQAALAQLLAARDARTRPLRDEKIILSWNALMIRALAEAGALLEQPGWIEAAEKALDACLNRLETKDGLLRIHADGRAIEAANLADIAWTGLAADALALVTGSEEHLNTATRMADHIERDFKTESGRYALSRGGPLGDIFEIEDGAIPSGEAAALELFVALERKDAATALARVLSGNLAQMPITRLDTLRAAAPLTGGLARPIHPLPGATLIRRRDSLIILLDPGHHIETDGLALNGAAAEGLHHSIPPGDLKVTVQICTDSFCHAPVTVTFRSLPERP